MDGNWHTSGALRCIYGAFVSATPRPSSAPLLLTLLHFISTANAQFPLDATGKYGAILRAEASTLSVVAENIRQKETAVYADEADAADIDVAHGDHPGRLKNRKTHRPRSTCSAVDGHQGT